jgi:hypothetical protein
VNLFAAKALGVRKALVAPNEFWDPRDCGTAKFFAAKALDGEKALVAPKNFGVPGGVLCNSSYSGYNTVKI